MLKIAKALIMAVEYINLREDSPHDGQSDANAVESIAAELKGASAKEIQALRAACAELIADERESHPPRPDLVESYSSWMENMGLEPRPGS